MEGLACTLLIRPERPAMEILMQHQLIRTILFGTGQSALKELAFLAKNPHVQVLGFVDNDEKKQGTALHGFPIFSPRQISGMQFDRLVIASMYVDSILAQLVSLNVPSSRIVLSLEAMSHLALRHAREGNHAEADRVTRIATASYGEAATLSTRAELAMLSENWPMAIEFFERACRESSNPLPPSGWARFVLAYRKTGNFTQGQSIAQQGLACYPDDAKLLLQAAEVFLSQEKWTEAIELLAKSIAAEKGATAYPYARLAYACGKILDFSRAAQTLDDGLTRHPHSPLLLKEKAQLSFTTQNWKESIQCWRQVWNIQYDDPLAFSRIMASCGFIGQHDEIDDLAIQMAKRRLSSFDAVKWCRLRHELEQWPGNVPVQESHTRLNELAQAPSPPPAEWWLSLFFHHYVQGHYPLAYSFKDIAAQIEADGSLPYIRQRVHLLGALLELGRVAEIEKILAEEIEAAKSPQRKAELLWDLATFRFVTGPSKSAFSIWNDPDIRRAIPSQFTSSFDDLVRGKAVALVGGADVGLEQGEEIDSFDVVVRMNMANPSGGTTAASQRGKRTTVSYYTYALARLRSHEIGNALAAGDLKAAVVHNHAHVCNLLNAACGKPLARINASYTSHVFMGFPLSAQRIVLDLLPFAPSRIKVFNCDFYLGSNAHHKGYVELNPLMPAKLAHHDLLRNLRLAKKLYALAQIETDSRLAEILAMDDDSFVSALQARWHGSSPFH